MTYLNLLPIFFLFNGSRNNPSSNLEKNWRSDMTFSLNIPFYVEDYTVAIAVEGVDTKMYFNNKYDYQYVLDFANNTYVSIGVNGDYDIGYSFVRSGSNSLTFNQYFYSKIEFDLVNRYLNFTISPDIYYSTSTIFSLTGSSFDNFWNEYLFDTSWSIVSNTWEGSFSFSSDYPLNENFGMAVQTIIDSIDYNYNIGYVDGLSAGRSDGYSTGYDVGLRDGYDIGYTDGYAEADTQDETAAAIMSGIVSVGFIPINFFLAIFNWEVFGINIAGFVSSILSVCVLIIVIKHVFSTKGD